MDYKLEKTQGVADILDYTLGTSVLLSVSEKGTMLFSILGLVEDGEKKKLNVIFEDMDYVKVASMFFYESSGTQK